MLAGSSHCRVGRTPIDDPPVSHCLYHPVSLGPTCKVLLPNPVSCRLALTARRRESHATSRQHYLSIPRWLSPASSATHTLLHLADQSCKPPLCVLAIWLCRATQFADTAAHRHSHVRTPAPGQKLPRPTPSPMRHHCLTQPTPAPICHAACAWSSRSGRPVPTACL
jgi:hypothetical protein